MQKSKLKKTIGEKAYNFLSRNFNDTTLDEILGKLFILKSDVKCVNESDFERLKSIINDNLSQKENLSDKPTQTAKEMLSDIGYILHDDINTQGDYIRFDKYYEEDEKLCKFGKYDATERYAKVFWLVSKDIDNTKRTEPPNRDDLYSKSCMSIGISKDKRNVVQICSRYNHTVSACDNLFNSNLDNIVAGLTEAFNTDYKLNLSKKQKTELQQFYIHEGKYVYYYTEINGIKYGNNTINGVVYDPSEYLVFDNFLLNLKEKNIETGDGTDDDFVRIVNEKLNSGYTIEIRKGDIPEGLDDTNKIIIFA